MINLCPPSIIYLLFSLTQIIIDTYKGLINTAIIKTIIMIMLTILLQILCNLGLNIVSWIIVFIPFVLMTVIVSIILYTFGLNAATGTIDYTCKNSHNNSKDCNKYTHIDSQGNIVVYDPYYDPIKNPVYYSSPNLIIPKPPSVPQQFIKPPPPPPPNYSSDHQFQ